MDDIDISLAANKHDIFIGGYRTHTDQQIFIDRSTDGYVMWMYEGESDAWEDYVEVYEPMVPDDIRAYFAHPVDVDKTMAISSLSDNHETGAQVHITIFHAAPGALLVAGETVPPSGVFAMNGELFVPLTPDREVGAHFVMFAE